MRDRIAEPLEEVADRIASAGGMTSPKKCDDRQDQDGFRERAWHNVASLCTTQRSVQYFPRFPRKNVCRAAGRLPYE